MQREKPAPIADAPLPGRHEARPATEWIVLSDLPPQPGLSGPLSHGLFICEVALPPGAYALLLDWQPDRQPKRTFSVYLDAGRGLSLLQRQGAGVQRKTLPGPLQGDRGTARILYGWSQQADRWFLSFAQIDTQTGLRGMGAAGRRLATFGPATWSSRRIGACIPCGMSHARFCRDGAALPP